jgi:hypothetical protein
VLRRCFHIVACSVIARTRYSVLRTVDVPPTKWSKAALCRSALKPVGFFTAVRVELPTANDLWDLRSVWKYPYAFSHSDFNLFHICNVPFEKLLTSLPQSQFLSTMAAVEAANGAFSWCTLALQEHGSLVCRPLHDMEPTSTMAPEDLDISTSAGWMEWIERTENRSHDSGGASGCL